MRIRGKYVLLGVLLALSAAGEAQDTSPTTTSVALRGRRILLSNLEQAVTLSASDMTSFALAQGVLGASAEESQRLVRVGLRVTNRAKQAQGAPATRIVLGSGKALEEEQELGQLFALYRGETPEAREPEIAGGATRSVSRYYRVPAGAVSSATVELHDRGVVLTMPLVRLLTLTAQRKAQ